MTTSIPDTNRITLCGQVTEPLQFHHAAYDIRFMRTTLLCRRLSGREDRLPVLLPAALTEGLQTGMRVRVYGQLRSYNEYDEAGTHLRLWAFGRHVLPCLGQDVNGVHLEGHLCKAPLYRTTPFGREIADLLLAVNRAHGKSDYLPVIVWGQNARFAGSLQVGQKVSVEGRFQSRVYEKQLPNGSTEQRTAYEVSAGAVCCSL